MPELTAMCSELVGPCITLRGTKHPNPDSGRPAPPRRRPVPGRRLVPGRQEEHLSGPSTLPGVSPGVASFHCWAHPTAPACSGVGSVVWLGGAGHWIPLSRILVTLGGIEQGEQPCLFSVADHQLGSRSVFSLGHCTLKTPLPGGFD